MFLLISSSITHPQNLHVCAFNKFPAPPRKPAAFLPAMPADSNPLAFMPFLYARAQFVDHAGHFVSGDSRICTAGEKAFLRDHIAVTDATSLHPNPHMSHARLRYFELHDFKVRSRPRYLHGFHFCHLSSFL